MGNITKEDRARRNMQDEFDRSMCHGYVPWRLYHENGEVFMWIIDAEVDPVRIRFDSTGTACIHTTDSQYVMLGVEELREIAKTIKYADAMWEDIDDD